MNDPHLLDLHSDLQNDTSGKRRTALLAQLQGLHGTCLGAQRTLCDRDAFKRLEASTRAVAAAIRIVETFPAPNAVRN